MLLLVPIVKMRKLSPREYTELVSGTVRTRVQFVPDESKLCPCFFYHRMPFSFYFLKNRYETSSSLEMVSLLPPSSPPSQDNAPYRSVLQAASEHLANGRISPHGSWKPASEILTKLLT